eukprot:scaffold316401_cov17-Tisochrysis_lutea.AAC.1
MLELFFVGLLLCVPLVPPPVVQLLQSHLSKVGMVHELLVVLLLASLPMPDPPLYVAQLPHMQVVLLLLLLAAAFLCSLCSCVPPQCTQPPTAPPGLAPCS